MMVDPTTMGDQNFASSTFQTVDGTIRRDSVGAYKMSEYGDKFKGRYLESTRVFGN